MLKKFPVPVCGLALGFAALGNLLAPCGAALRYACGAVSLIIVLLFTIRVVTDFGSIRKELENPVAFSVFPTYTMAVMLLAAYAKPFIGTASVVVWFAALILQFAMMACFIKVFVVKFNIKQVFPSWFVMFVGIVVASVTSPAMGQKQIGQLVFYIGLALYLALLPVVLYRVLKAGAIPEPARPSAAIFCAPSSLCVSGYLAAFDDKSAVLAAFIAVMSLVFWLAVLVAMFKLLRLPFFPSYSAFTFPFVISAVAFKGAGSFFPGAFGGIYRLLSLPAMIIAAAAVLYVLGRYCGFWFGSPSKAQAVSGKN